MIINLGFLPFFLPGKESKDKEEDVEKVEEGEVVEKKKFTDVSLFLHICF